MRAIIAIIVKDFYVLKKYWLFIALYLVVFPFAFKGFASMSALAVGVATIIFVSLTFAMDEVGRASQLIASLPLKRAAIPLARYLETLGLMIIGSAVFAGLSMLFGLLPFTAVLLPLNAFSSPAIGILSGLPPLLLLAVMIPLWYRFGYIKTRILNVFLFVLIFSSGSILSELGSLLDSSAILKSLSTASLGWLAASGSVFCLGVLALSCLISIRIYERKEF